MPSKRKSSAVSSSASALAGLTFCMTGTMSVSRSEMEGFIQANGGDVVKTVTNKCTHLMSSESGTKKCADAKKKGVAIVDETWVREQCGDSEAKMEVVEEDDNDEKEDDQEGEGIPVEEEKVEEEEELPDNIYIYFKNHPLSQYLSSATDSSCLFQSQEDGTMKFWKFSIKNPANGGKVQGDFQSGTVGTEEGMTATTVEYENMGAAIRHTSQETRKMQGMGDEDEDENVEPYNTFEWMYRCKKEEQRKKAKKTKMINFPTNITGKIVCDNNDNKIKPIWVSFLQKFLSSYGYLGDPYILDYSDKDTAKWKWYEAFDAEDGDDYGKKRHNALVKKDKFVKQASKETRNKNKFFNDDTNAAYDFVIFEVSIDGTKFFLLSFGMCVNDPLGQCNVLYDSKKNEIFRIDAVQDSDDADLEGDGQWRSAAMKTKYKSLVQRIEPLITSQDILNCRSICIDDTEGDDSDFDGDGW